MGGNVKVMGDFFLQYHYTDFLLYHFGGYAKVGAALALSLLLEDSLSGSRCGHSSVMGPISACAVGAPQGC